MAHVTYDIVEHDGGFAYKVGDVFSETFPTHQAAHKAAASSWAAPPKPFPIRIPRAPGMKSWPRAVTGPRPM